MPFRILCVITLASILVFSQTQPQQPQKPFQMSDVECYLATTRLNRCEKDLKQWQDWIAENKDALSEYEKEKGHYMTVAQQTKEEERREIIIQYASFGGGVAAAGFALWGVVVALKRFLKSHPWRPFTPDKKQLVAVLLASIWISLVGFVVAQDRELMKHPINLLAAVFVFSLPAILFGGISFWWYGRKVLR